jgi:segregation and condensation protein A
VTLGELIQQLEEIAERLEQEEGRQRSRSRSKRFSDRAAMEQVAALAHREKLPETTAALSQFLLQWPASLAWVGFDGLVDAWAAVAPADLDCDRVGCSGPCSSSVPRGRWNWSSLGASMRPAAETAPGQR